MFLTPLQELPFLGRNPVYIATLFLFVIFQIPLITAKNIHTVLAMRFMTGLFGSPALATGVRRLSRMISPATNYPALVLGRVDGGHLPFTSTPICPRNLGLGRGCGPDNWPRHRRVRSAG